MRKSWSIIIEGPLTYLSFSSLADAQNTPLFIELFFGNISTAYNGGFTSIRYNCKRQYINEYKNLVLRIKGDEKEYQFRIKWYG